MVVLVYNWSGYRVKGNSYSRLKFGEHVDDHQLQIISEFEKMNFIKSAKDISELEAILDNIDKFEFKKYISNTRKIINNIEAFLESV